MVVDRNVAYLGSIYPHHAEADIEEIAAAGCTSVNITVNEMDWFYYRRARKHLMDTARRHRLKVYLNLHGFGLFASPIPSGYFQMENPECRQVFNSGLPGGNVCCPNSRKYKEWLTGIVTEMLAEFKPDGIFWDEPRFAVSKSFPDEWACRCKDCREEFRRRYHAEMPRTMTPQVMEFRQDTLRGFLQELLNLSKSAGPVENVLCLMSWDRSADARTYKPGWYGVTAWEPFVRMKNLDVFSTDPYWIHEKTFEYFESNARRAIELAHQNHIRCQIWVQAVWIEPGKEPLVGKTLRAAAEYGADMLAVWSFRGEPGSSVLYRGGDLDLVWRSVKETYLELSAPGHPAAGG